MEKVIEETRIDTGQRKRRAIIYGLAMLVALIGIADSLYLTVEHIAGRSVKCTVTGGCSKVLSSPYAITFGIPTAALGLLAYFSAFSLATLVVFGYRRAEPILAALVALMLAATVWLFFLQAFVLHAFCQYCLLSAASTLALAILVATARFSHSRY